MDSLEERLLMMLAISGAFYTNQDDAQNERTGIHYRDHKKAVTGSERFVLSAQFSAFRNRSIVVGGEGGGGGTVCANLLTMTNFVVTPWPQQPIRHPEEQ